MADVIPFALWRRPQARTCPFPQTNAEILFFTGVRYERPSETTVTTAAVPRGRRATPAKAVSRRKARQPA